MNYSLPFKANQKVIEIGGGNVPLFRPNLDVRKVDNVDIVADLNEKFPIKDQEWDGVFSKFSLEHISWRNTRKFISEVYRILKTEGTFVAIVPNTEAQMKWVLDREEWDDHSSCILFGDNDYPENTHRVSLSPAYIIKLLQESGFNSIVVIPWGEELRTDMLIEARKNKMTTEDRKSLFDKHYFNGGEKVGGYAREGYWDYPVHNITFNRLMEFKPESVLEVGSARGYIVKKFQDIGIPATGLEISKHCWLTRACNGIVEWDICKFPWPLPDKSYDLCVSVATLEHIPEEHVNQVISEMDRICKRGIHGIDFGEHDDGFDKTHCTLRSEQWWKSRMPVSQQVVDKEKLEKGNLPLIHYLPEPDGLIKVNVGSFTNMFHGWVNLDIIALETFAQAYFYKFLTVDVRTGMPFADKSVHLMYSSHFVEHLTYEEALKFFAECKRVMKPGGTVRIMVPDMELLINKYRDNTLGDFDEINDGSAKINSQVGKLWSLAFPGHSAGYDFEGLKLIMNQAGFAHIEKKRFREGNLQILRETIDMLPELSLYVEAYA